MAANTPLCLAVHAVLLALLCTQLDAQQDNTMSQLSCMGGQVISDSMSKCVTLGAEMISFNIPVNTTLKLTVYAYPLVGNSLITATLATVTLTDQLLIPAASDDNRYMVYARQSDAPEESPPNAAAASHDDVRSTMVFIRNPAVYMTLAAGSDGKKSRVTINNLLSTPGTISLLFRSYDDSCYTGSSANAACSWTRLDDSNNDLSYGIYEFYVASTRTVNGASVTGVVAYPRPVLISSVADFYSTSDCAIGRTYSSVGGDICRCFGTGYGLFNISHCAPIGRVLRAKGFRTNKNVTLTLFQSQLDVAGMVSLPPRRIFQKSVRITDDLLLSELTPLAYSTIVDYESLDVYSSVAPEVESLVKDSLVSQHTLFTQSTSEDSAGLFSVKVPSNFQPRLQYRNYTAACQGADATGNCEWLDFGRSQNLSKGAYEMLPSFFGQYPSPPILYYVGNTLGISGAPAAAVLPTIFSLVCLVVLAIGLHLD